VSDTCLVVVSVICFAVVRVRQIAVFKARLSVAADRSPVEFDRAGLVVRGAR